MWNKEDALKKVSLFELRNELQPFVNEIIDEVIRATGLHGTIHSLHEAHSIIEEEFDEFWDLVKVNPRKLPEDAQKKRLCDMHEELIQVASMCVRTILDCHL